MGTGEEDVQRQQQQRRVLEEVFGSPSSDLDDDGLFDPSSAAVPEDRGRRRWERVEAVKGLWLCREFLDPEHQSWLLACIDGAHIEKGQALGKGWFPDTSHNQAMRFGDIPEWARAISSLIRDSCLYDIGLDEINSDDDTEDCCPLPNDILCREPLFDQLIANSYEPGEGICAHVDLMRFEDGIAIVSLRSPCVMHFTPVEQQGIESPAARVPVLLTPGSLVVMSGEARYSWKHEINRKPGFQVWEGEEIAQQRRTSVTLRKLCPQA